MGFHKLSCQNSLLIGRNSVLSVSPDCQGNVAQLKCQLYYRNRISLCIQMRRTCLIYFDVSKIKIS